MGLVSPGVLINHIPGLRPASGDRKQAGTDLTQNLPNGCADFQKTLS
jgi:hypothetical protein